MKYNQQDRSAQKRLEEFSISCEVVLRTMRYDTRPEAQTRIGKVLLDFKEDLNHTNARYRTFQKRVMELQNKIKCYDLVLTKADKENTVMIMLKDDYTTKSEAFVMENKYQQTIKDPTRECQNHNKEWDKRKRRQCKLEGSKHESGRTKAHRTCKTPQEKQTKDTSGKLHAVAMLQDRARNCHVSERKLQF